MTEETEYRRFDVAIGGEVLEGQRVASWERRSLPRRVTYADYVRGFARSMAGYAFLVAVGLEGLAVVAMAVRGAIQLDGAFAVLVVLGTLLLGCLAAGAAGAVALWVRAAEFNEWMEELEHVTLSPMETVDELPALPPARETRVEIPSGDGRAASFLQPRPGEFANWVAAVLRDDGDEELGPHEKTTLSQNTGTRRGWSRDMYRDMLAQMKLLGWFVEGANRVPEPTDEGRRVLLAWLRNEPPHPARAPRTGGGTTSGTHHHTHH